MTELFGDTLKQPTVKCLKASSLSVPPFSALEVYGVSSDSENLCKTPSADSIPAARVVFTGALCIPSGETEFIAFPASNGNNFVDYTGDAPDNDDDCGTVKNSFKLKKNKLGFKALGVSDGRARVGAFAGKGTAENPVVLESTGEEANTDEWDIEDQPEDNDGVQFVAFRMYWSGDSGDPVYQYTRDTTYNSNGILVAVGPESRSTAFDTDEC